MSSYCCLPLPRIILTTCANGVFYQVTAYQLKQMEVDKKAIGGQLRDMEWKLDQESKVRILQASLIILIHVHNGYGP